MSNKENKDFDKYIKSILSAKEEIPAGLEWENMDIELPSPKEKAPNKKWIISGLLLLLAFLAGGSFYFLKTSDIKNNISTEKLHSESEGSKSNNSFSKKKSAEQSQNKNKNEINFNSIEKKDIINEKDKSKMVKNKEITKETISFSSKETEKVNSNENSFKNSLLQKSSKNKSESLGETNNLTSNGAVQSKPSISEPSISTKDYSTKPSSSFEDFKTFKSFSENLEEGQNDKSGQSQLTISGNLMNRRIFSKLEFLHPIPIEFVSNNIEEKKIQAKAIKLPSKNSQIVRKTLFLKSGINLLNLKYSDSSVVQNKIGAKPGLSFELGFNRSIAKKYYGVFSIGYHEAHTAFTHSRKTKQTLNFKTEKRENHIEHIYHNNYSKLLQATLGLGRKTRITNLLSLKTQIGISTGMLMSIEGQSLDDEEALIQLETLKPNSYINLSLQTAIGLNYQIGQRYGIEAIYHFNPSLNNHHFIDSSIQLKGMQQFMIGIHYKM